MGRQGIEDLVPPEKAANALTQVLNTVLGGERFPVDVGYVAKEYTAQRFPDDPITLVKGAVFAGFDGALVPAPAGKKGWGILYNSGVTSPGRINFTLAHELGHYIIHRVAFPEGFQCGEDDFFDWDSDFAKMEQQANTFAATLLMPLDDFRRQISADAVVDIDELSACADRYRVSLIASVLRWLQYTTKRALLVVSRDGFVLWSRSSPRALKTRAYIRTSGAPVPLPPRSLAARGGTAQEGRDGLDHPKGVWFNEAAREIVVWSEQYSFTLSLLILDDAPPPFWGGEGDELEDTYARFMRNR